MKKTIIVGLIVLVIGAAAYMYQDLQKSKNFTPVHDFARDDEALYQRMRKEMQQYLGQTGEVYGGWLDDEARTNFESGSYQVAGRSSKAAAYAAAAGLHYPPKKRWFNQLISNLNTVYR
jgi:hypothetical protein